MKSKLSAVATGLLMVLASAAGPVLAQEPTPAEIVEDLADRGYLQDPRGLVIAEIDAQVIEAADEGITWAAVSEENHTDFIIAANITWTTASPDDGCGFVIRRVDEQNYYTIGITRRGAAVFSRIQDGGQPQTESITAFDVDTQPGAANHLLVNVRDESASVFVNGTYTARFRVPEFESGSAGLALHAQTSDPTTCTFSNIWVWEPREDIPPPEEDDTEPEEDEPEPTGATGRPYVTALTAYDQGMLAAITELEQRDLVPSGGRQVFRENYAFFEGQGNWFTPLASGQPFTHVVLAAEITFQVSGARQMELCGLMARIIANSRGDTNTFLEVSFSNSGEVVVVDLIDGDTSTVRSSDAIFSLGVPHHLLFTVFRDRLNVYVDGELVLEEIPVQERAGFYGISLMGQGSGARCEGRDIWAYQVDAVVDFGEDCGVRASGSVNLRAGPGTTYDRAGTLEAAQTALVIGQFEADDGYLWYQIEGGSWVRSDVIAAGGNCTNVPTVTP